MGDTRLVLAGLAEPVEILVDRWGVPHVYAGSADDAFRAQGFNAARERLWQLDFWRRRGLGLLAEAFGPALLERDRAARLFTYRGDWGGPAGSAGSAGSADMAAEWAAYGPGAQRTVTAFVEGVNAYVRLALADPALLPVEFRELGYAPALWEPADVVRVRANGLYDNVEQEVARARTLRDYGPAVEDLRRHREPPMELVVPDGLELAAIPDDVLDTYWLALDPPDLGASPPGHERQSPGQPSQGSNNWVLGPDRTTTGRPLLANDPHRALSVPSLRYLAHLSAPGLDVIGAGEPALPGVAIGHNGSVAFGLTIFPADQEDLYCYATDPRDPHRYRYGDGWEAMAVVRELVPVRGGEPVPVELAFTRHGPVVWADPHRRLAFAVRAAWLAPGGAPYLGSLAYLRARTGREFTAALAGWGTPPENFVHADTTGAIGWQPAGLVPVRPGWDGTLPVPGDGRYEWRGWLGVGQLPAVADPPRGWLATANECTLPAGYPAYERVVSFDWYAPTRATRIAQVLDATPRLSAADCVALQADVVSLPARRVLAVLAELAGLAGVAGPAQLPGGRDPRVRPALDLLLGWDGELGAGSAPAALFEVWYRRHLRPALLRRALAQLVPPGRVEAALALLLPEESLLSDPRVDLDLLERPAGRLGPDGASALEEVVVSSLAAALAEVEVLLGPDPGQWAWGRLHVAAPVHPAAHLLSPATRRQTAVAPLPRGGSGDTVANAAYGRDFHQGGGATFRLVVDVGDWDASLVMNAPGQSGDPASTHYADLAAGWARGDAFPLLYSRAAVQAATESRIELMPASGGPDGG